MSDIVPAPMRFRRDDFSSLRLRARRYLETIYWLILRIFHFDRRRFLFIIYIAFLGRAIQAAALALLFFIAHSIESGAPVEFAGLSVAFASSENMVFGITIGTLMLLVGAVLIFAGKRSLVDVSTEFGDHCSRDALVLGVGAAFFAEDKLKGDLPASVRRGVVGAFMFTRAAMAVLTALGPITVLIFAIIGLIYLAPDIALSLAVFIVPTSAFVYLINLRAVQNQRRFLKAAARRRREVLNLAGNLAKDNRSAPIIKASVDQAFDHPEIAEAMDSLHHRLLATTRAEYVANFLIAIAASALATYLVIGALGGDISWIILLSTLVALRFVLTSIRSVVVSVTQYARFHPAVRSLFELMTLDLAGPAALPTSLETRSTWTDAPIPLQKAGTVRRGDPVALIAPYSLGRFTLPRFSQDFAAGFRRLAFSQVHRSATFVTMLPRIRTPFRLSEIVDREGETSSRHAALDQLRAGFPTLPLLDDVIDAESYGGLSRKDRVGLALSIAILGGADVLFIDADMLNGLSKPVRDAIWAALSETFVTIVYAISAERVCFLGEASAILADGSGRVAVAEARVVSEQWPDLQNALWLAVQGGDDSGDHDDEDDEMG